MASIPPLTPLQETEREALCGDRQAIARLVSAVRKFRVLLDTLADEQKAEGAVTMRWTRVTNAIEKEERWESEPA